MENPPGLFHRRSLGAPGWQTIFSCAVACMDGAGQPLDGTRRYSLRFAPGQLPEVDAFWSLTLYDPTYNFTANPINRFSIGDRTEGLEKDADGGLTIYIQSTSPGKDKESNWLPSTPSGQFLLIIRAYMPGAEILEQK